MRCRFVSVLIVTALLTSACEQSQVDIDRPETSREFPRADRPVSGLAATLAYSEQDRDSQSEATIVMDLADIRHGMTVADIGAGDGYYTVRLSERVGQTGRVLAQDIDDAALRRLGERVERERLDNVSIKRGLGDDPMLPEASFDRIFLVHMYHEVAEPYAFLYRLRPALRKGGKIIVVDYDRPTDQHGINPQLLFCEFQHVGYELTEFVRTPQFGGYYAQFEAVGSRPEPKEITPCVMPGTR